ncbi:hypothetical protein [Actinomyces sp. oral taxon 414]|uniref:hypothetical protein n=1 Tax=Actinomyces sp. oral taxon 414 TaxID=712122 RepID=UPI0012EE997C|nr:hypothetical protein [Actinomyces sp. oral taxon 414]
MVVFIRRQVRLETPLLDVGLFKGRVFTVAILTGLFSLLVWSAIAYLSMTYSGNKTKSASGASF